MPAFRCYALDADGHIIAREDVTSDDLVEAIAEGWRFVASRPVMHEDAIGLEVWQESRKLFPAAQAASPGPLG